MRRYRTFAPYLLPLVCGAALLSIAAQKKESGSDPYIPTKLEWLTVEVNAAARQEEEGLRIFMIASPPNTIRILSQLLPESRDRHSMNLMVQFVRAIVKEHAEEKGWDDWLVIREELNIWNEATKSFK
jgi:hypothetical protein